jgi:hypothetical protein
MKTLSTDQRDTMVEAEVRKVTRLYLNHCYSPTPEGLQTGIDALDAHWREVRHSPVSKWIRFYVVGWKSELLSRMGRLDEALVQSDRSQSLPATPYARIVAARSRAIILRKLDRPAEAFHCAMTALRTCARTRDVESSQGLILEIVRLGSGAYVEELAAKYGKLVLSAAQLPNQMKLLGSLRTEMPIQVLNALREAIESQGAEEG